MDYAADDKVPVEIVHLATCEIAGDWRFGTAAKVWRDGIVWRIRPIVADESQSTLTINGHDGISRATTSGALVSITNAKGCTIDGRLIDIRGQ